MSDNGDDEVSSKGGKKKMADLLKSTQVKTLLECLKKIESNGGNIDADSSDDDGTIEQLTKLCENGAHALTELKQTLAKKRDGTKEAKQAKERRNVSDGSNDEGVEKVTRNDKTEKRPKEIMKQEDSDSSDGEPATEKSSDIENVDDLFDKLKQNSDVSKVNDKESNESNESNEESNGVAAVDGEIETDEPEQNGSEASENEGEPKIRLKLVPLSNLIEPIPSTSKTPSPSVGPSKPKSKRQNKDDRNESSESSNSQSGKSSAPKSKQTKSISAKKKAASTDSSDSSSDSDSTQNTAPSKKCGPASKKTESEQFKGIRKVPKIVLKSLPHNLNPLLKEHNLSEILNEKQVIVASVSSISQSSSAVSSRSSSRGASTSRNCSEKTKNGTLSNGQSNNIDEEQVMRAFVGKKI